RLGGPAGFLGQRHRCVQVGGVGGLEGGQGQEVGAERGLQPLDIAVGAGGSGQVGEVLGALLGFGGDGIGQCGVGVAGGRGVGGAADAEVGRGPDRLLLGGLGADTRVGGVDGGCGVVREGGDAGVGDRGVRGAERGQVRRAQGAAALQQV